MVRFRLFFLIVVSAIVCTLIALPSALPLSFHVGSWSKNVVIQRPRLAVWLFGREWTNDISLKQGLDIQGGMQVVLQADMTNIAQADRLTALESVRQVMQNRVDLYGVSEPVVQTSFTGQEYRILVELAGVKDADQALALLGTTAELDFRLEKQPLSSAEATVSAVAVLNQFLPTQLTGKDLQRASVQFDGKTGQPVIGLAFTAEGKKKFADITSQFVGKRLGIFLDGFPIMAPTINTPIYDGQAVIQGQFTTEEAKQLSIQLNAGALPVPVKVVQQQTIGASLGQASVTQSVRAGVFGLGLVILFMIIMYGWKGVLASISLLLYAICSIALYKIAGITVTVPGIAGLLLTIGMAVDANILIFERMKEEQRAGKSFSEAMRLGFGRAWTSIKDANIMTILVSLILLNPLDFPFLSTSGLVRGFGLTLLLGVLLSLFTGMVVTRTLMHLFLRGDDA